MHKLKAILIIIIINQGVVGGFSQRTTIGFLNGINFSDINNAPVSGKWQSMPGPLTGIYLNYKLNNFLALNTEINYLTLYYQYKSYHSPYNYPLGYGLSSSVICYAPIPPNTIWSFSYLRLPIMIKFYTPTRLGFHFSVGGFISQMISNNMQNYYDLPEDEPLGSDYGLMFASGISYSFQNKLNLNLEIRYAAGKKQIIWQDGGQNGDLEIGLGVGYTFTSKKKKKTFNSSPFPDTLHPKLSVKYAAGAISTKNIGKHQDHYGIGTGFSGGLSLFYHANKAISFQADILFQRKSYVLNDSSSTYSYYKPYKLYYFVDTKTDIDYINIPILMNIFFDRKSRFYMNMGFYTAIRMNARLVGFTYNQTRTESGFTNTTRHVYDNIEGEIKNTDWGVVAGTGFQTPVFKKYKLDISLRYESSFVNIYKQADENKGIKLRSLSLMAGIIVPIK